jgi:hypothetical protein
VVRSFPEQKRHSKPRHVRGLLFHRASIGLVKQVQAAAHPELAAILATDADDVCHDAAPKAFDWHAFSAWFAAACDKAGLPSACTFHGLGKAACRRLAEAGARCAASHLTQSSSGSRFTAGAAGFLLLTQSRDRPER